MKLPAFRAVRSMRVDVRRWGAASHPARAKRAPLPGGPRRARGLPDSGKIRRAATPDLLQYVSQTAQYVSEIASTVRLVKSCRRKEDREGRSRAFPGCGRTAR